MALKTFVDNVCWQVIERYLFRSLSTIFYFKSVAVYGDEDLKRIVAEVLENIMKKKDLRDLYENYIGCSLRDLHR